MTLDQSIQQNSAFFDGLVGLVLAKHYFDNDAEPLNLRYMKKDARAEAKKQFKEQYKQNKKEKLKPDAALTALAVQQKKQQQASESSQQQQGQAGMPGLNISSGAAPSREELRAKLQKKLEVRRTQGWCEVRHAWLLADAVLLQATSFQRLSIVDTTFPGPFSILLLHSKEQLSR